MKYTEVYLVIQQ